MAPPLLLVASFLLNIFMPPGTNFDIILRVIILVTFFAAAYLAEVIRGGLAALPRGQYEAAATLAQHSFEHGPRLGGLCRRNWATLRIARELANDALGAQAAGEQLAQCTVAPPVRM